VTTVTMARRTFAQRVAGAAALRRDVYEEVEADRGTTGQAVAVVLLASVAAGIGLGGLSGRGLAGIPAQAAVSLVAWAAWAVLTLQIGTRLLPERRTQADVGELLRTIGFSAAPGWLLVLALLPGVSAPLFALTSAWMVAAMVVAVRQALDYTSTIRAVAVCVIGWLLIAGMVVLVGLVFQTNVS
jgi:hypothetical protein